MKNGAHSTHFLSSAVSFDRPPTLFKMTAPAMLAAAQIVAAMIQIIITFLAVVDKKSLIAEDIGLSAAIKLFALCLALPQGH